MSHAPSNWVAAAGMFNLTLAFFHMTFWRVFNWPASLESLGGVNRGILYVLNLAVTALFFLAGVLLLGFTAEVVSTGLGSALLWGLSLFWLARAAIQPPMFGLGRTLSVVLFLAFLIGSALHGYAAFSSGGI